MNSLKRYSPRKDRLYGDMQPDPSGDWTPHDAAAKEIRRLREALENVDATLCECRYTSKPGCNCDVHASHKIIYLALASSTPPSPKAKGEIDADKV